MAYTSLQLINQAFFLSGINSQDLQTLGGDQAANGLIYLNDVLALKTAMNRLIPYYTEYDFNSVVGQEEYSIPDLVEADTVTFTIGDVRYAMAPSSRKQYQGSGRVNGINSLPFSYYIERKLGGCTLFLYFATQAAYPMKIWGKFSLSSVTLNQDLSLTLDKFFQVYLKFALAEYICLQYQISVPPDTAKQLQKIEAMITDISAPDLTVNKLSMFQGPAIMTWAQVNLGRGWTP